jgi:AraC-like DNA-binding protein
LLSSRSSPDAVVVEAAVEYLAGHSLTTVATEFKVHARTLAREFRKAGVAIRPRRGWNY